jgi:hypothetical protein
MLPATATGTSMSHDMSNAAGRRDPDVDFRMGMREPRPAAATAKRPAL